MAGNIRLRMGDGRVMPLPSDRVFIEILTLDGKIGMVIFESEGRIFIEQPGEVNFANYCQLFKQVPAPRSSIPIKI
jgi:hypothetical protein